jgi:alkyl hydroperoxide reductase subunit AhpC
VTWRWRWPPWEVPEDTTEEARTELKRLERRDPEVKRLGAELRQQQRENHFSGMVWHAIQRGSAEGR